MCLKITSKKVYVYSAGRMEIEIESHRQWHHIKIPERKVPSQCVMQRCAPEERNLWATNFEERSHEAPRKMRPQRSLGSGENAYKLKKKDKTFFLQSS